MLAGAVDGGGRDHPRGLLLVEDDEALVASSRERVGRDPLARPPVLAAAVEGVDRDVELVLEVGRGVRDHAAGGGDRRGLGGWARMISSRVGIRFPASAEG